LNFVNTGQDTIYFVLETAAYIPNEIFSLYTRIAHRFQVQELYILQIRTDKTTARVPKMSCAKISLAWGIRYCPMFFTSSDQPASLYYEECVYIYTYLTV